jgi:hypothetical protein
LHEWIIVYLFNSLCYTLYAILSSSKLALNLSGTRFELSIISVPRKLECPICQTRVSGFEVWVLEYILFEYTSRGSPSYCYTLLLFIKCLEVYWIDFMLNSLTKPECLILVVLIPLWDLLNFRIAYSPPSMWHQGTFNMPLQLLARRACYIVGYSKCIQNGSHDCWGAYKARGLKANELVRSAQIERGTKRHKGWPATRTFRGHIKGIRRPQPLYPSPGREVSFMSLHVGWYLPVRVFPPGITWESHVKKPS